MSLMGNSWILFPQWGISFDHSSFQLTNVSFYSYGYACWAVLNILEVLRTMVHCYNSSSFLVKFTRRHPQLVVKHHTLYTSITVKANSLSIYYSFISSCCIGWDAQDHLLGSMILFVLTYMSTETLCFDSLHSVGHSALLRSPDRMLCLEHSTWLFGWYALPNHAPQV